MTAALAATEICVFDAYGTLFDFNSAVARHRAAIGPKADALADLWRAKQIQYTWLRNGMGAYDKFWQVTGEALDHCLAAHGIADAGVREKLMRAYLALDPFPEVPAMLDRLTRAGKRLAILSNGDQDMLEAAGPYIGFRFDHVISVEQAGYFKPHWKSYAKAAEIIGENRSGILFVANHAFDCIGAKSCGMRTAFVDRRNRPFGRTPHQPDLVVADFAELAAMLA